MPISAIDGCNEAHWQAVCEFLKESLRTAGFAADLVSNGESVGIIHSRIVTNILTNDLIVCDVSGKNPNVMLELGLRLATDKPIVIIKDDKTTYSFDSAVIEHLEYPRDLSYPKMPKFGELLKGKAIASTQAPAHFSPFLRHFRLNEVAAGKPVRKEPRLSRYCRLVHDKKQFDEHQQRLVVEARELLYSTGSRSKAQSYLSLIEQKLTETTTLHYTRILFGPIRRPELELHCSSLQNNLELCKRARICAIEDLSKYAEAFVILNEREALVVVPSLNATGNFDTGLLLTGYLHLQMKRIVESYSRAAIDWKN